MKRVRQVPLCQRQAQQMNRSEFIIAVAVILFVTFAFGWLVRSLLSRFTRVSRKDVSDLDKMAEELHQAEETRDQAIAYMQNREAELSSQLAQTEAELNATMDGLRSARQEAEELRAQLEARP